MKRFLSLVVAFVLLFSLIPMPRAHAHEEDGKKLQLCQTELEAIDYVRKMLLQRVNEFTVQLPMRLYDTNILETVYADAVSFSENPKEGASLLWQSLPEECYTDIRDGFVYLHYSVTYLTTAQEESELDEALNVLLAELNCNTTDRYGSVKKLYDWVCANVSYDESTPYADSAYGALIQRKASGYGYSLLLYQLFWKLRIPCRMISGLYLGQGHAWIAVGVGGSFYFLDGALDAGKSEYQWFLKGKTGMIDHESDLEKEFPSIGFAEDNYEDRVDPCEQMGHYWVGGSCVEPKICNRCGVKSQEYDRHSFYNDTGCEYARFCDTCKELILPTGHTYLDAMDLGCENCSHRRIVVCAGEVWRMSVWINLDTGKPKITADPNVTLTEGEARGEFVSVEASFPGEGRYWIRTERGGEYQPEDWDVHVIDHARNASYGDCACFDDGHDHSWLDASCMAPRTCSECGLTEGEKWDHIFHTSNCVTEPGVCFMCGLAQESPPGHEYYFNSDDRCRRCDQKRLIMCSKGTVEHWLSSNTDDDFSLTQAPSGVTVTEGEYQLHGDFHYRQFLLSAAQEGEYEVVFTGNTTGESFTVTLRIEPHGFNYGRCYLCQEQDPSYHFHSWVDATCTEPKTCSGCGLTEGRPKGHHLMDGACSSPRGCSGCDLVLEAPSHYYSNEEDPDCNFCGRKRYSVCGNGGIGLILSSDRGGDFSLTDKAFGLRMELLEFFVAEGINYWEYVIYTPGPGVYEVEVMQADGEDPIGLILYVYDHEFSDGICRLCGIVEGKHLHNWQSAACDSAAICTECGQTDGHELNHDFSGYKCSETAICNRCGAERPSVEHRYTDLFDRYCDVCSRYRVAGCEGNIFVIVVENQYRDGFRLKEAPSGVSIEYRGWHSNWGVYEHTYEIKLPGNGTYELVLEDLINGETFEVTLQKVHHEYKNGKCVKCSKEDSSNHVHDWYNATCQEPKYCLTCGKKEGKPAEHNWFGPSCTEPKICGDCGITSGKPLGHDFYQWSCVQPAVCTRCNTIGPTGSGHSYDSSTADRCNGCNQLRLFVCQEQPLTLTFTCDTEIPFTLASPPNRVSMVLESCVAEGEKFLHTYRISFPGKGTYELTCTREEEPNREDFTVLVGNHQYSGGQCSFCGLESQDILGDVDGNGILNYNDALLILRASIGLETLDEAQMALADVNEDGKRDYSDALKVLRISIGLT